MSWATILRKRQAYQAAFHDFDIERVAEFTEEDVSRLLLPDSQIIKNKLKVMSTVTNARCSFDNDSLLTTVSDYVAVIVLIKFVFRKVLWFQGVPLRCRENLVVCRLICGHLYRTADLWTTHGGQWLRFQPGRTGFVHKVLVCPDE